jgi:hypothetical protein
MRSAHRSHLCQMPSSTWRLRNAGLRLWPKVQQQADREDGRGRRGSLNVSSEVALP